MEHSGEAPGFYGKLRSHGDFVGRRLPPAVRDCLDQWLQEALQRSKQDLGLSWQPAWLNSPLWRFVLSEGVCGAQAWTGVMMPSHDRVGRCFPLLLATALESAPSLEACLTRYGGWFAALEDVALSSLGEPFTLDGFDAALAALGGAPQPVPQPERGAAGAPAGEASRGEARVEGLAGSATPVLAAASLAGNSAWWTEGSPLVEPCLAVCAGLPAPGSFAAMLDGAWAARGWRDVSRDV